MHAPDKKEQSSAPQENLPQSTPVSNTNEQTDAGSQPSDDAPEGDYAIVGSGLGIDE